MVDVEFFLERRLHSRVVGCRSNSARELGLSVKEQKDKVVSSDKAGKNLRADMFLRLRRCKYGLIYKCRASTCG